MDTTATRNEPSMRLYIMIWIALLVIVGVEVGLTYMHLPTGTQLTALLALAFIEAGLGVMYFMHLKYERTILFLSIVPTLLFVLLFMDHFWPDALRLLRMRLPTP
jgi:cytochrome c oxidase subunit IV